MSEPELVLLLRRLFAAYRDRFHVVAPQRDPPVPMLAQKRVDVVAVNGGQALHFFFSDPPQGAVVPELGPTRLHNVTMWPQGTKRLREIVRDEPQAHRDHVRRTARIRGVLYVHFVLFPEDGDLEDVVGVVGARLAEREVARAAGEELAEDVPAHAVRLDGPDKAEPEQDAKPWDPALDPAP